MRKAAAVLLAASMLLSSTILAVNGEEADTMEITVLKTDNIENSLGIDTMKPVFSWQLDSDGYGKEQSAYQIEVAADSGFTDSVWDSGKQAGENNYDITYAGEDLSSKTAYFWRVTVWDEDGSKVGPSDAARFETGMLPGDWEGKWLEDSINQKGYNFTDAKWIWLTEGASAAAIPKGTQYFRKSFAVDSAKTIAGATIGITCDDEFELYINGETVGQNGGTDSWRKGNFYDAASLLKGGNNTIAVKGANTSVGYSGLLAKMVISYTDGSTDVILTDNTWKVGKTAAAGWQKAGFDDSGWKAPDQALTYGGQPWNAEVSVPEDRAAPMFRKRFNVDDKKIEKARLYISGLGMYEASINGDAVTDAVMEQGNTQYTKTVPYGVYDVGELLEKGENVIGVTLGHGFFNEDEGVWNWPSAPWRDLPKLLAQLEITYADGSVEKILTDESWQATSAGPTTYNSIYSGEEYDARLEMPGWDTAAYASSGAWHAAAVTAAPAGTLKFQYTPPMRRIDTFAPKTVEKIGEGKYAVYSPEMVTGWAKLKNLKAAAGDEIKISYCEKISDGVPVKFDSGWFPRRTFQQDIYTFKGDPAGETFEPRFSYKGYEYILIEGYGGELTADNVEIYRIASDMDFTSAFSSSNSLIDKMHKLMLTTTTNNLQGKPTDTPVWEKNGWVGDLNVASETMMFNHDMSNFLKYFEETLNDVQTAEGWVEVIAPNAGWSWGDNVVWNSVYILMLEDMYNTYGNRSLIESQYARIKKQIDYQISKSKNQNGWTWNAGEVGDWVSPMGGTDPNVGYSEPASEGSAIVGTGYFYLSLQTMAKFADMMGRRDDAADYRSAMDNVAEAFNSKYLKQDAATGAYYYDTGTWSQTGTRTQYRQTSNIVALMMDVVPRSKKQSVIDTLLKDIEEKGNHLDVGIIGARYILPTLTELGYEDVAYQILTADTYPSWGHMALNGTSLWEMWENTTRSRDHYFLGTYDQYLFEYLGGVKGMEEGYKTFTLEPNVLGDLAYVNVGLDTVRGDLESRWTLDENNALVYTVEIPVGSTATVKLPTAKLDNVQVNGKALRAAVPGIRDAAVKDGKVTVTAGSGKYVFQTAIDGYKTDKSKLEKAVDTASGIDSTQYTPAGAALLAEKLNAAKKVLDQEDAAQIDIAKATNELEETVVLLDDKYVDSNRKEIAALLARLEDKAFNPLALIPSKRIELDAAIAAAEKLCGDPDATEAALKAAKETLEKIDQNFSGYLFTNLALGAGTIYRSQFENGDWKTAKINDGDVNNKVGGEYTGYTSTIDGRDKDHEEWVGYDLGRSKEFTRLTVYPSAAGTGYAYGMPRHFIIQASDDGAAWRTVNDTYSRESGNEFPLSGYGAYNFTLEEENGGAVNARYVRLFAQNLRPKATDANYYYLQLTEMEVYNAVPQTLAEAKTAVEQALERLVVSNGTTEEDVLAAAGKVVSNVAIAVGVEDFKKTEAGSTDGRITATVALKLGGETAEVKAEWVILKTGTVLKGDLNGDGSVNITDVMELCKVLARKSMNQEPTADEVARGDLTGEGVVAINDVMALCKVLANRTQ